MLIESGTSSSPQHVDAYDLLSTFSEAWENWTGEVDTLLMAWSNYFDGTDTPCPNEPSGVHSTYLIDDGSCDYCGEKNRS